jgi:hypothetical protein
MMNGLKLCFTAAAFLALTVVGGVQAAFNPTWTTAVDHTATSTAQTSEMRPITLSNQPGNNSVYIGYIQSTGANNRRVEQYSTNSPYPQLSQDLSGSSEQPKGIVTDNRGNVFVAYRNSSVTQSYIQAFTSNLTTTGSVTPNVAATVGGIAIQQSGVNYYAYTAYEGNGLIQRFNVTNPGSMTLDSSFGTSGSYNIPGATDLRGIEVGLDGSIYAASRDGGKVYRISSDLSTVSSFSMTRPMDVALYANNLFVTSYNGASSLITVLNATTMAFVQNITISTLDGNPYSRGTAEGWAGIDIGNDGRIWLSDEHYAGTSASNTRDRLLVSSSIVPVPEPAMIAVAAVFVLMSPLALRRMKGLAA